MAEQKELSGVIFKNDRKTNVGQPGYTGSCTIGGVVLGSAWVKDGTKGKFFSLAFKPKQAAVSEPKADEPFVPDEDIPF